MALTTDSRAVHQCPLCHETFAGMRAYTAHLGEVHNLYDDDGVDASAVADDDDDNDIDIDIDDIAPDDSGSGSDDRVESNPAPPTASPLPIGPQPEIGELWTSASAAERRRPAAAVFIAIVSALILVVGTHSLIGFDRVLESGERVDGNGEAASHTADHDWAKASLLSSTDIGPGWAVEDEDLDAGGDVESSGDADFDAAVGECESAARTAGDARTGIVVERDFSKADELFVFQQVGILGDAAGAQGEVRVFGEDASCVLNALARVVGASVAGEGATFRPGSIAPLALPPVGEERAGRTMTVAAEGPGGSAPMRFDVAIGRQGRAVTTVVAIQILRHDATLFPHVTTRAVDKLLHYRPA